MKAISLTPASCLLTIAMAGSVWAGELKVGSADAVPGQPVTISIDYTASGKTAAALASDVRFNTNIFKNPRCTPGSNTPPTKSVRCGNPSKGVLRLAVFGLNTDPIGSGEVAKITFDVAPDAKKGRYKLRNKPSAADKDGNDFRLSHAHGAVRVAPATK